MLAAEPDRETAKRTLPNDILPHAAAGPKLRQTVNDPYYSIRSMPGAFVKDKGRRPGLDCAANHGKMGVHLGFSRLGHTSPKCERGNALFLACAY
jgi:hypothetical protein